MTNILMPEASCKIGQSYTLSDEFFCEGSEGLPGAKPTRPLQHLLRRPNYVAGASTDARFMFTLTNKLCTLMLLALAGVAAQSKPEAGDDEQLKRGNGHVAARRDDPKAASREEAKAPEPVPIPAMAPEELPATAPRVSYRDGRLFVDSDNSTLDEILKAVGVETGAQIEALPSSSNERVAVHLSGSPSGVIAALLDGAKFGYVILSSSKDPDTVVRVVLTMQSEARPVAVAQAPGRRGGTTPQAEASPVMEYPPRAGGNGERSIDPDVAAQVSPGTNPQPSLPAVAAAGPPSEDAASSSFTGSGGQRTGETPQVSENALLSQQQQTRTPAEVLQDLYRQRQQLQPQNQQPKQQQN